MLKMDKDKCNCLLKEEEELSKEVLREKNKEKATRLEILVRALERYTDELKRERDDHLKEIEKSCKIRKISWEQLVIQEKTKLSDELEFRIVIGVSQFSFSFFILPSCNFDNFN